MDQWMSLFASNCEKVRLRVVVCGISGAAAGQRDRQIGVRCGAYYGNAAGLRVGGETGKGSRLERRWQLHQPTTPCVLWRRTGAWRPCMGPAVGTCDFRAGAV